MSRATEDVNQVRNYLGPAIMYAINTVVLSIMVIYAMYSVNGRLADLCIGANTGSIGYYFICQ
jgi:ATP-binding cassette subfamily B protein